MSPKEFKELFLVGDILDQAGFVPKMISDVQLLSDLMRKWNKKS